MKDIDYFSEERMGRSNLGGFRESLPPSLRDEFNKKTKGISDIFVLQGYRGPMQDSGLYSIGFWFGASKHLNWIPVAGTVVFGAIKAISHFKGYEEWRHI